MNGYRNKADTNKMDIKAPGSKIFKGKPITNKV